jgi:hypothetical protein
MRPFPSTCCANKSSPSLAYLAIKTPVGSSVVKVTSPKVISSKKEPLKTRFPSASHESEYDWSLDEPLACCTQMSFPVISNFAIKISDPPTEYIVVPPMAIES